MSKWKALAATLVVALVSGCATHRPPRGIEVRDAGWRGVHLLAYDTDADLEALGRDVPTLAAEGVNVIILEVDYNFAFMSHPDLRRGDHPVTLEGARRFASLCRAHGVRVIPEFQSLGHQSWETETFPLLTRHPDLDLTPGAFPGNKGLYCREWDPLNPEVNRIVFDLMDEIVDAFEADALHVGMDEVFLLGSDLSPSTRGKDPAELFARVVNDLHRHLVDERHLQMLMWGDRLFDGKAYDWGEWESSLNGTAAAVDRIPKDIIICPWHYEKRDAYPSIPMFMGKGFRVLPTSWKNVEAALALVDYSEARGGPLLLGHLFSTWGRQPDLPSYPPLVAGLKRLHAAP